MRLLVAGGAGFVGSHLCDHLIADGHSVVCLDNLLTGSLANIEHLLGLPNFRLIQHEVSEPLIYPDELDGILHLASPASPKDYQAFPIETLRAGALGTLHLLDLALANRARFLLASTSEVYGDPEVHPQPEDYWGRVNPIGPRSVYDEAKRFAEALTMAYHRSHNLDVKIVRIFNTYGPRMRSGDGRVVPAFVSQALRGDPLTVFGDGTQSRSFCYVDDLIGGIVTMLNSSEHGPVNLGNPGEFTMLELAEKVIELTGSMSPIEFHRLPQDDPTRRKPDIRRAKTVLGWEPRIPLEEGLVKTIGWFRDSRVL
jgi:dTDP-glucose 4,6-dehydratase